jgi:hypothetical protein
VLHTQQEKDATEKRIEVLHTVIQKLHKKHGDDAIFNFAEFLINPQSFTQVTALLPILLLPHLHVLHIGMVLHIAAVYVLSCNMYTMCIL